MKKISISILALAALLSCSKASLDEATPQASAPKGETICVNIPSPTKSISLSDYQYAFQGTESLVVVSSEGKIATLTNTAESPYSFSGAFDGALGAESDNFTVYYNCYSASSKALSFTQNGQPWLTASLPEQTRDEDGHYSLSPVLEAVKGIRTVAVVSDYAGTVSFHAKTANISSFAGGSFSGSKDVNDLALTADNNGKYIAFVNIPSGMTGGYWLKVTKAGESGAMYKSYASDKTISENQQVTLSEFTPAEVKLDVAISGFYTSYSYYVGNEGVAKNISTANSTANTAMGAGEASYTVSFSGISSKLLSFSSFKLNVAGTEYTGSEGQKISASASTQSTWGQKNIVATVVYKSIDGVEFTASKTLTRYITGLPYSKNFSSDTDATGWTGATGYQGDKTKGYKLAYYYKISGGNERYTIFSPEFNIPSGQSISTSYSVGISGWQTGAKASNGSAVICVGATSGTLTSKDMSYTLSENSGRLSDWGKVTSYTFNGSTTFSTKNRIVTYVETTDWGGATQHYILYNTFSIQYNNY